MSEPEQVSTNPQSDSQEEDPIKKLIPNGIENFVPSCIVCREPVPRKRATGRSKDTCGPLCHKVLRLYRQHIVRSGHCPSCYHPSSPAERQEFLSWRKSRGDRRDKPGRPKKNQEISITSDVVLLVSKAVPREVVDGIETAICNALELPKNAEVSTSTSCVRAEDCNFGGFCKQPAYHAGEHDPNPVDTKQDAEVEEHFKKRRGRTE